MEYTEMTALAPCGTRIEYGVFFGSNNICFIKSGKGGTYRGHENKYLKIAEQINNTYGYTVICASNPENVNDPCQTDINILEKVCTESRFTSRSISYIGISDGARKGLAFASTVSDICRLTLINMPLMINFMVSLRQLSKISCPVKFVYAEHDPSVSYIPFLPAGYDIDIIPGADHMFYKMESELYSIMLNNARIL